MVDPNAAAYLGGSQTGTASATTGAGASGGAGMAFGALSVASAISSLVTTIYQGKVASAQADYNRIIMEGKARMIEYQKQVNNKQYNRYRNRYIGTAVAATAGAGFMLSGSPAAVMVDSVTQINVDQAISNLNIEMSRQGAESSARMYGMSAKGERNNAMNNAFAKLLQTGTDMSKRYGKIDTSQGATKAGRV